MRIVIRNQQGVIQPETVVEVQVIFGVQHNHVSYSHLCCHCCCTQGRTAAISHPQKKYSSTLRFIVNVEGKIVFYASLTTKRKRALTERYYFSTQYTMHARMREHNTKVMTEMHAHSRPTSRLSQTPETSSPWAEAFGAKTSRARHENTSQDSDMPTQSDAKT